MKQLTNPLLIQAKGLLFLLLGTTCAVLLLLKNPSAQCALLLAICIWSFCRFYYFAFYVLERYVDPRFRFSGLASLVTFLIGWRRAPPTSPPRQE